MAEEGLSDWLTRAREPPRMLNSTREAFDQIMRAQTVWNGSEAEARALLAAVARYCACQIADTGAVTTPCAAHDALVSSQRFLDGLLFGRRIASRLIAEEWRASLSGAPAEWRPEAHSV